MRQINSSGDEHRLEIGWQGLQPYGGRHLNLSGIMSKPSRGDAVLLIAQKLGQDRLATYLIRDAFPLPSIFYSEKAERFFIMAYIYKITNQINGKVYIGKTINTIEERWKKHKQDYRREYCKDRPFYKAMNKYGPDNFIIEEIEQCDISILEKREIYWIDYYRAYVGWDDCKGYNATLGGDGKSWCDYDWVYQLWQEGKSQKIISKETNYDKNTIHKILLLKGITSDQLKKRGLTFNKKACVRLNKNTEEILDYYDSLTAAADFLWQNGYSNVAKKDVATNIGKACKGKRKTAYGYKWQYQ